MLVSGVQQCDFVIHIAMDEYRYIDQIQNILYSQLPVFFLNALSFIKKIYLFILIGGYFLSKIVMAFAIHQHESAIDMHVFTSS